jgi:hypothetical protein
MISLYKWFVALICRVFGIKNDDWVLRQKVWLVPWDFRAPYPSITICKDYMDILLSRWTLDELTNVNMIEALTYVWDRKPLSGRDRDYIRNMLRIIYDKNWIVIERFLKNYKNGKYNIAYYVMDADGYYDDDYYR